MTLMMDSLRLRLATPTIGPPAPATPAAPPLNSELVLLLPLEPVEKPPPVAVWPKLVIGVRNPAGSGTLAGSVPTGSPSALSAGAAGVAGVPSGLVAPPKVPLAPFDAELLASPVVVGQPAVEELEPRPELGELLCPSPPDGLPKLELGLPPSALELPPGEPPKLDALVLQFGLVLPPHPTWPK